MRWRHTLIPTLRQIPKEAEATSHQLLLKAGFIHKLSSGVYSYLPLGLRVLQKVSKIIREEMAHAGSDELLMPSLHPAELWKKTGRYDALGGDKISFKNRSEQEFVLGPTHEEVITDLVASYIQSHNQLPVSLYQIQTKFRDELRPRFGIVRTKEFIMKDAYSFHASEEDLDKTYDKMYEAYKRIYARSGLSFEVVGADTGIMGGKVSHEFMVRSPYGEDHIAICAKCKTATSRDIAMRKVDEKASVKQSDQKPIEIFDTPNLRTIQEISGRFSIPADKIVKTILYYADGKPVAALVSGSSDVNESKLRKVLSAGQLTLATAEQIRELTGSPVGFSGPAGLKNVQIVADGDVALMSNFVTGANQKDKHCRNVNLGRDFKADLIADIRYVKEGDVCAACGSSYELVTAMEIGHTFKLGIRYSKALSANFKDEKGEEKPMIMGCYGIGVNRIMAASVDQHHDEKGIVWPKAIAPFDIEIITVNQQDENSAKVAEELLSFLEKESLSVLYDDRDERAGVKFNDADLVGIPVQVVVSERNLAKGELEVKTRFDRKSSMVKKSEFLDTVRQILKSVP